MKRITAINNPEFYKRLAKEFEENYLYFKFLEFRFGRDRALKKYNEYINRLKGARNGKK